MSRSGACELRAASLPLKADLHFATGCAADDLGRGFGTIIKKGCSNERSGECRTGSPRKYSQEENVFNKRRNPFAFLSRAGRYFMPEKQKWREPHFSRRFSSHNLWRS